MSVDLVTNSRGSDRGSVMTAGDSPQQCNACEQRQLVQWEDKKYQQY